MSWNRKLAGVFAAVLLGTCGGAWGQTAKSDADTSIKGLPPAGLSAWSVFSCITPHRVNVCVVPVLVKRNGTGTRCEFNIPHVIEFDPSSDPRARTTRRIRWELVSIDSVRGRDFKFVQASPDDDPSKLDTGGIQFLPRSVGKITFKDDRLDDDETTPLPEHRFGKRLRATTGPADAALFLYTVHVEWKERGGSFAPCEGDPPGPAIINRGR